MLGTVSFLPTLHCIEKARTALLESVPLPLFHHRLFAFIWLICWTGCWRKTCNQWLISLNSSSAVMQSNTRSRLYEFLAHGLVSGMSMIFVLLVSQVSDDCQLIIVCAMIYYYYYIIFSQCVVLRLAFIFLFFVYFKYSIYRKYD